MYVDLPPLRHTHANNNRNTVEPAGYSMETESVAVDIRNASSVGYSLCLQRALQTVYSVLPLE